MKVIDCSESPSGQWSEDKVERALRRALGLGLTKIVLVGMDDRPSGELCMLVGNVGPDETIGILERAKAKCIRMIEDPT